MFISVAFSSNGYGETPLHNNQEYILYSIRYFF